MSGPTWRDIGTTSAPAKFPKGCWVVQTRGRYRGRVGQVSEGPIWSEASDGTQIGTAIVQFGADGPFASLKFASLRKAEASEIPEGAV